MYMTQYNIYAVFLLCYFLWEIIINICSRLGVTEGWELCFLHSIEKSLCKVVPLYVVGFIISWFTGALGWRESKRREKDREITRLVFRDCSILWQTYSQLTISWQARRYRRLIHSFQPELSQSLIPSSRGRAGPFLYKILPTLWEKLTYNTSSPPAPLTVNFSTGKYSISNVLNFKICTLHM